MTKPLARYASLPRFELMPVLNALSTGDRTVVFHGLRSIVTPCPPPHTLNPFDGINPPAPGHQYCLGSNI